MFDSATYYKTEKGREELALRNHDLPSRLRTALILIDGRANGERLRHLFAPLGNAEDIMQVLIDQGYVESDFDLPSATSIAETFASLTAPGAR